jgi:hypothetical protein
MDELSAIRMAEAAYPDRVWRVAYDIGGEWVVVDDGVVELLVVNQAGTVERFEKRETKFVER